VRAFCRIGSESQPEAASQRPIQTVPHLSRRTAVNELGHEMLDTLSTIWQQVLGKKRIDVDANFFDVGGNAWLAIELLGDRESDWTPTLPTCHLPSPDDCLAHYFSSCVEPSTISQISLAKA